MVANPFDANLLGRTGASGNLKIYRNYSEHPEAKDEPGYPFCYDGRIRVDDINDCPRIPYNEIKLGDVVAVAFAVKVWNTDLGSGSTQTSKVGSGSGKGGNPKRPSVAGLKLEMLSLWKLGRDEGGNDEDGKAVERSPSKRPRF